MEFQIRNGEAVVDVQVEEGSHAFSGTTQYYKEWNDIPVQERETLLKIQGVMSKAFDEVQHLTLTLPCTSAELQQRA